MLPDALYQVDSVLVCGGGGGGVGGTRSGQIGADLAKLEEQPPLKLDTRG